MSEQEREVAGAPEEGEVEAHMVPGMAEAEEADVEAHMVRGRGEAEGDEETGERGVV